MIIISGLTKCFMAFVTAMIPSGIVTYVCLPENVKQVIKPYLTVLEKKYAYFLVSKTHPIRGAFYYKTDSGNTETQSVHYQQKLAKWKNSATSFNQSTSDLFLQSGKKSYKCAIPIPQERDDQLKVYDNDCRIFRVNDGVKKISEVIDSSAKDENEIKEKLHIEYNKMYLLRINLNNLKLPLTTALQVDTDLIVDIVDYDTDEINHDKCILSFSIDNYWLPENETWKGKVSSILANATNATATDVAGSATTCVVAPNKTPYTCVALYNPTTSTNGAKADPLADISKLTPIDCSKIAKDSKYVIYFLSNKFEESNFADTTTEYQYSQCSTSGKPKELAKFMWEKSLVGYVDFVTPKNNHLFTLE